MKGIRGKEGLIFQPVTIFSSFKRANRTLETHDETEKTPRFAFFRFEEHSKGIISDCNAMNYTQIALEINFYFSKFNMLWILRVTSDISSAQKSTPFYPLCFLFVWGCCKHRKQFTIYKWEKIEYSKLEKYEKWENK